MQDFGSGDFPRHRRGGVLLSMAALDYLRRAGLAVDLDGDRLRVAPADRITADLRQFVRNHRTELLAELSSANDEQAASEPKRNAWQVTLNGNQICNMVMGAPATRAEALAEARWRWPAAEILEN